MLYTESVNIQITALGSKNNNYNKLNMYVYMVNTFFITKEVIIKRNECSQIQCIWNSIAETKERGP